MTSHPPSSSEISFVPAKITTPQDLPNNPRLEDFYNVHQPSPQGVLVDVILFFQGFCGFICGIMSIVVSATVGPNVQIANIFLVIFLLMFSCACCGICDRMNKRMNFQRSLFSATIGLLILMFSVLTYKYCSVVNACYYPSEISGIYYGNSEYYSDAEQCHNKASWDDQFYCFCYTASNDYCMRVEETTSCSKVIASASAYAKTVLAFGSIVAFLGVLAVVVCNCVMPNDLSTPPDSFQYSRFAPQYRHDSSPVFNKSVAAKAIGTKDPASITPTVDVALPPQPSAPPALVPAVIPTPTLETVQYDPVPAAFSTASLGNNYGDHHYMTQHYAGHSNVGYSSVAHESTPPITIPSLSIASLFRSNNDTNVKPSYVR